jgi:hypothetical protein
MVRVLALAAAAFAALSPAYAARFETSKVELRDVTGEVRITTTTGDQTEVKITQQGKSTRIVDVRLVDGVLVLSGERWKEDDDRNCCDNRITRNESLAMNRAAEMNADGLRKGFFSDWPLIEIAMPRKGDATFVDARILLSMQQLDGALNLDACYVYGETATLGSAVIGVVHGSRLAIGNVKSLLELDLSGRAEVRAENAAMTDIDIAGPGVVTMGAVDGMMDVSIAGSGRVLSSRLEGPLTARIAGSGVVSVQSGVAERLKATIDGSGGVYFDGVAVQPDLRLYGSAVVRMDAIKGRLTRSGGGQVYIADKLVEKK